MAIKPIITTTQGTPSACPVLLHGVPAVAKALGIGQTYTWALIRDGKLPCCKIGRRTLIREADLQAFAASLSR